jgi:hypothetical protein
MHQAVDAGAGLGRQLPGRGVCHRRGVVEFVGAPRQRTRIPQQRGHHFRRRWIRDVGVGHSTQSGLPATCRIETHPPIESSSFTDGDQSPANSASGPTTYRQRVRQGQPGKAIDSSRS